MKNDQSLIFTKCIEVFGTKERAERWMKSPNLALGGKTPASLVIEPKGLKMVEDVLNRIEYGIYE
jgi:putative toxin-antitoxin system antitoxin component (TIGR02293 family)